MSSLNPAQQLASINSKIIASLGKLSEVYWVLLQAQAQLHGVSPTQLQLLLFIRFHPDPRQRRASFMAREFHVTKATISDSVRALEQKGLVERMMDVLDTRSFILSLTEKGKQLAAATEAFTTPLDQAVEPMPEVEKDALAASLLDLIYRLNDAGIISLQRMCYNCRFYSGDRRSTHYCQLLQAPLGVGELRLDCGEFSRQ